MNIGSLEATLGVDTKGLNTAAVEMKNFQQQAEMSLDKVSQTLDKTGRNIYYFGTASMRFLTLPLALAGGAAVKMGMDFETAMQKIVGLVGVSQSQVTKWSASLLKLGPELDQSPKDLANALYFVTSSGFKGSEALNIVTQSAKATVAGLGDTKDIADLVTSAMNAYAGSNLTAVHTLDVLTAAVREGKGEATDYAKQMGDVIPIASKMGVSFDQVAAAMASVTLTGTKVSEASTQMRQILTTLLEIKPNSNAAKSLEMMGTSAQNLRSTLSEKGLMPALMQINELSKKYGDTVFSNVFPNVRALTGALSLMGDKLNANRAILNAVTNSSGDMQKAFLTASDTIEFKFNQDVSTVKASMIELALSLRSQLIPLFEGFAKSIQSLTQWYTNLSVSSQQLILKFGIFLAILGPLTISIGLLMRGLNGIIATVRLVDTAITGLSTLMMANPITATVILLGVLATAIYAISRANNEAAVTQKAYNDALAKGKELAETLTTIDEQMKVITSLNKMQVQTLKDRIAAQLKLEDDYQATVLGKQKEYSKIRDDNATKVVQDQITGQQMEFKSFGTMLSDKANAELKSNQNRINQLSVFMKQADSVLKSMLSGKKGPEFDFSQAEAIAAIMQRYQGGLQYIKVASDVLGVSFDGVAAKLNLTKTSLDELFKVPNISSTNANIIKLTNALSSIDPKVGIVTKTMTELNGKLATNYSLSQLIGETYKLAEEDLKDYSSTLETLGRNGVTSGNAVNILKGAIQAMNNEVAKSSMKDLTAELAHTAYMNTLVGDSLNGLDNIIRKTDFSIQQYTSTYEGLYAIEQKRQGLANPIATAEMTASANALKHANNVKILQEKYKTLGEQMQTSLMNGASSWNEYGKMVEQTIRQMITAQIALALTKAIVSALDASVAAGPVGLFLIPAFVAIALGAVNTAISSIPGFAQGGTVPPGYPNDTYLAKLTSGEQIIPAGKENNSMSDWANTVVFKIEGYTLTGILQKQSKKLSKA